MYEGNDQAQGGMDPLAELTSEELRQLLQLGTAPDQQQLLQQQLMQAQALRGGGQPHTTPMGALLGGIANAGGELAAGMREKDVMQQMRDLQGQQVDARQLLLAKILRRGQSQPSEVGAGDVMPPATYGLG